MSFADAKVPRMQGSLHSLRPWSRQGSRGCLPAAADRQSAKVVPASGVGGRSGSAAMTPKLPDEIKKIAKKGNDRKDAPKDPVRFICQG